MVFQGQPFYCGSKQQTNQVPQEFSVPLNLVSASAVASALRLKVRRESTYMYIRVLHIINLSN